jgi:protein-L-isoaspartate(D-aspartate) O-methyltransferase
VSRSKPAISDPDALIAELARHVGDERVLEAIRSLPRTAFVPSGLKEHAWENVALPIGSGQTISQPLVVARMLELLELQGEELVLDIGTGSGYHAALLARLARRVISIERHEQLSSTAAAALEAAGVDNVELIVGDGSRGLPERAPFDAINLAAASDRTAVRELIAQLGAGGRLVAPLTEDPAQPEAQRLVLLYAGPDGVLARSCEPVRFVPLVSGPPT